MHCVFSTKERRPQIVPDLQDRLWAYLGGIARDHSMTAISIGGTCDHCHALLSLPGKMDVSKAMQLIKGGSSKWVHDTFPRLRDFAWQEGFGAFSIAVSQIDRTVAYIQRQTQHHRRKTFKEEFLAFLKKHRIGYDERYIWN